MDMTEADLERLNFTVRRILASDEREATHHLRTVEEGYGDAGLYGVAVGLARVNPVILQPSETVDLSHVHRTAIEFVNAVTDERMDEATDAFTAIADGPDADQWEFFGALLAIAHEQGNTR